MEERLGAVLLSYNLLPLNAASFYEWVRLKNRRSDTLIEDAMNAATAIEHRLSVVTRIVRDVEESGVDVLNPFECPTGLSR